MDAAVVWKEALKQLEERLNKPSYESFIKAVAPRTLHDDTFSVTVPSRFAKEWLESRYHTLIGEILQNVLQRHVTVEFTVAAEEIPSIDIAPHPPLRTTEGMPLNAK
ncbi:MAG: hypothetical protein HY660_16830, partial [Armatimonadetes bacterium]|nr:hypothetical protein [Armatimonadota bacterium]